MSGYRVGIVGATGVVGREALRVLRERNFPASALRLFASARSAGMRIGSLVVEAASRAAFHDLDLIIFDTPDEVARELVPSAAAAGALVIDNSAAFRMEPDVPLVIPEVNADALRQIPRRIIANPNCTTATIAVPLAPLHRAAGVRRLIACSYQSVSGAGQRGVDQLWAEVQEAGASRQPPDRPRGSAFAAPIAMNLIPAVGSLRGGAFSEEIKVAAELRKLLSAPRLAAGVTCVRVPTLVAHGVAARASCWPRPPASNWSTIPLRDACPRRCSPPAATRAWWAGSASTKPGAWPSLPWPTTFAKAPRSTPSRSRNG